MKLLVVVTIIGVCAADRLDNKYLPPRGNQGAGYGGNNFGAAAGGSGFKAGATFGSGSVGGAGGAGGSGFGQSGAGFGGHSGGGAANFGQSGFGTQHSGNVYNAAPQQYSSRQNSQDASAQILRLNSDVTAEGFSYDFETSNGIRADASGVATNGVQSQGSFAYKGDDGQDYSITYTADENGYQPQGAHLPTPPPIPEAILKSLEQNARDEAAGISDDGNYRGEGAGSGGYSGGYSGQSGAGPSSQYGAPARSGSNFGAGASNIGAGASNFGAGASNFGAGASNFGAGASKFGAGSGSSGFGSRTSNFGSSAASRQYLAPNAGPRGSGNGNFNAQSGYRY